MVKFQALGEEKAIKDPVLKTPPSVDTSVYGGFRLVVWLKSGLEWAARLGLLFSTLGLAVALRLPVRGWQMVAALLSLDFDSPATRPTPFDALNSPFPFFPLFLLLIWLIAALVLLFKELPAPVSSVSTSQIPNPKIQKVNREKRLRWLLFGLTLIVLLIVGWAQRSAQLLPDSLGRFPQPNYDEMVYYSSAAAFAAGHLPYRDFFTAHPPGTFALFAAFFKLFGLQAGGPDTFLAGRWFSVIQGLLTVVGTFWAAGRLWATLQKGAFALGAAFIAGLLYALDGRASEIAMLENVSNLVAIVGFSCFLEGERAARGRRWHWLVMAGGLASAAALTKLPGIALIFALLVYLFYRRDWRGLGLTLTGAGLGFLLIEGPFIGLAGLGEVLRQQVFFQMLRPQEVRSGLDEVARIAGYPEASLTVFLGGLGFCLLAWLVLRRPAPMLAHLLLPALWSVPLLVIFIFSKSFHPWYYVQWALPLALLAGGLGAVLRPVYRVGLLGLLVLTFPLLLSEWQAERKVDYDRVYGPVANFIQSQPSGATALFALDPGYNLMAGLPSARLPSGKYLIDGSSYLLYLNLEIDRKGLGKLLGQALGQNRDVGTIQELFERPRGQSLVTLGLPAGGWAALDGKIALPQLTPRSVEYIATASGLPTPIDYVRLYRVRSVASLREWHFENGLLMQPFGLSTSFEGQANYDPPDSEGVLHLSSAVTANRILDLRLAWRVERSPAQQLKVFVHLIDEHNQLVAQRDLAPLDPATDTRRWLVGDAFQDVQSLPLPDLSPGRYRVILGLYDATTDRRIQVEGQDSIMLGDIIVSN